jgi:hypothetical protein
LTAGSKQLPWAHIYVPLWTGRVKAATRSVALAAGAIGAGVAF